MGNLLIRDVEDRLIRTLKTKAEINGTSLQQEATEALRRGAPLTGPERERVFEELRRELGGFPRVQLSGADLLRELREEEG